MSVGYPLNKQVIDSRAGDLAVKVRDTFRQVADFKTVLDGLDDATLQAAPFGYTSDEVALLKSAIGDLAKLGRIANALDSQAEANDFLFWARRLLAVS